MSYSQSNQSFNEKQLRSILDNTVEGIVVIDSKGTILSFNRACERLFGHSTDEILGKNVNVLVPFPHHAHHDGYITNYLNTREAKIIGIGREVFGKRKDNSQFPMWLSISEVIEDGAHFFVGMIRDITEQKRHEGEVKKYTAALERSNSELDDFVNIVSHDLKEPVRGIYGYSQFLQEDYGMLLDEDGSNKLQCLMRLSERMEHLIDKLLYFSRLNKTELSHTNMDINKVIDEVLVMMEPFLLEQKASVVIETELPVVMCDQARVDEIFRNLIANGIKYNDNIEKIICIGVTTENKTKPGQQVFYVKDNGIGIPEKHYESVFKMFKRLHSREAYGGGTGSGLTIVKKIIGQHNGDIWLESKLGEGTVFYFTLEGNNERD